MRVGLCVPQWQALSVTALVQLELRAVEMDRELIVTLVEVDLITWTPLQRQLAGPLLPPV
jgi:hypothetical protein